MSGRERYWYHTRLGCFWLNLARDIEDSLHPAQAGMPHYSIWMARATGHRKKAAAHYSRAHRYTKYLPHGGFDEPVHTTPTRRMTRQNGVILAGAGPAKRRGS